MVVIFIADRQSSAVEQPTDGSFHLESLPVPPQRSAILCCWFLSSPTVRTDQFNLAILQTRPQPIGIRCFVIQQPFGPLLQQASVDQCFHGVDLSMIGRGDEGGEWNSLTIHHQHDLGSLTLLGLANLFTPFFAGANVPSAIASSQLIPWNSSNSRSNRVQAASQMPASVHSFNRRQQVAGEGYRSGKSFHRAPVYSTHKIPSRHSRGSTLGRPPALVMGGVGNRSAIRNHWQSSRKGGGAVLDPVVFGRRRGGHCDREMIMCVSF